MSVDVTPRIGLPELAQMQELDSASLNDALIQLDVFTDACFKGQFVNTPPSSPADGDTWLLGGTPTGAWSGYAYKIAYCLDGAWRFYTPFDGMKAVVAGGNFIIYQGGSWSAFNPTLNTSEVTVASAATCDIGAAGSLCVAISGATTITSLGTGANCLRFVRFSGALTLTHSATSLILKSGASRVTAAGDSAAYLSDSSGNWREIFYSRAGTRNAYTNFAGISPAFTSATSKVMLGQGASWGLTPRSSGTVRLRVSGWLTNSGSTGNNLLNGCYGTGTAPGNGTALSGTALWGMDMNVAVAALSQAVSFGFEAEVSGLTLGTHYWFDLAYGTSGGAFILRINAVILEEVRLDA